MSRGRSRGRGDDPLPGDWDRDRTRVCATCGREMTPRASWKRLAEPPRYCSKACRRQRPGRLDRALETAILDLLAQRDPGKTICPSEAARAVFGDDDDRWRDAMERTRRAARRLVAQGRLRILQGGRVVDPSTAKGPIRLGRPRR